MAAICDYIADYFTRKGYMAEISGFETGEALLDAFSPGIFDIVFIDIGLPGMSGMDTARKIRESDRDCALIFVTVSADYAMDGFGVQASGYVVKPIEREKMDKTLHLCRDKLERGARRIRIPVSREGHVDIPLANIRYAEAYNRGTRLYLRGGDIETRLKLEDVERQLGGTPFLHCHGSFIVNMNHVDDVGTEDFSMQGGGSVPIRKNGRKEIRLAYAAFLAGNVTTVARG
jgi:DNA-binding LytR/AlgR family response regulator